MLSAEDLPRLYALRIGGVMGVGGLIYALSSHPPPRFPSQQLC